MAIFDITNELSVEVAFIGVISTDTTTNTSSIDLSDFDSGYMFTLASPTLNDGTYVLTLQDSPDDSVWTNIPADKLIDPGGAGSLTISATTVATDLLGRIGAFSTNKFVRGQIVSTGTTVGADIIVNVIKSPEQSPVA